MKTHHYILPVLLLLGSAESSLAQVSVPCVLVQSGEQRARFVTYHYDTDLSTGSFERAGYVSDGPREWSHNLGAPGPNQPIDPFEYSSDGQPRARHVVIMVHGYGPPFGTYFLDREEDFFTGDDILVHESGATAWFDMSQSGAKDQNGQLLNNDAKLYPYLRLRPAEYGFDPDEWVVLAVTINILQNIGCGLSILENAERLTTLMDGLWDNYKSQIKTISFVSHSTGSAVVKSALGERGQAYRNAHPWIAYVDDHINLAGALGGTPAVLLDLVGRHRPIGHQLLYGIQNPSDYNGALDRYSGGMGLANGTFKRSYRWPSHINVMSVAGVWDGGPLLGKPALPVPPHQPLDGNPHSGNGMILIPNEVFGTVAPTSTIWARMGKSDGVVPNLSVVEQIAYRPWLPGSSWHDQVSPSDQYGIDMSGSWVLPSAGDPAGGGRIGAGPSNADNIPAVDRFPGSKITYVEVQAEHNGMLHNEYLMRAIKRRLGTYSVTPNVRPPVVNQLIPADGPITGGNTITISGSNFRYVTSVHFGEVAAAAFTVLNESQITVQVPPGIAAGIVNVDVRNTAGLSGQTASELAGRRYTYLGTVAPPVITPNGGDFSEPVPITLTTATEGAQIYYTWTDSEPGPDNSSAQLYTAPFQPPVNPFAEDGGFTLRVRAHKAHHYPSETVSASFNAGASAHAPVIGFQHGSPPDGTVQVSMSAASAQGAVLPPHIYYTTNGTDPTYNSTIYQGPFSLGIGSHTIKARTIQIGFNQSAVTTESVTVFDPSGAVSDPIVTPIVSQDFTAPILVTMENFTEGAVIRYTLAINDGVPHDPPETGPGAITYTGSFVMNIPGSHMFIKARAFKTGAAPSSVVQTGQLNQIVPVATAGTPAIRATIVDEPSRGVLPGGWTAHDGGGNDVTQNGDGGYLLLDDADDWIVTEAFDLSGYTGVQFYVDLKRHAGSGSNRHMRVEVSNDDGATWDHQSFVTPQAALNWATRGPFQISASGKQVRLRSQRVDSDGNLVSDGRGVGLRHVRLDVAVLPSPHSNTFHNRTPVYLESFTPHPDNPNQNLATHIVYTTDGSEPEKTLPIAIPSRLYPTGGFTRNASGVVKALAFNSSLLADSETTTADFVFKGDRPLLSPPSGTYIGSATVHMTSKTVGAQIRYTLDGTEPHDNSPLYSNPVTISSDLTNVVARAFRTGYEPSEITSATYEIGPAAAPEIQSEDFNETLIAGDTLKLKVYVTGAPPPDLQWYFNEQMIADATADSLVVAGVTPANSGTYSIAASNDAGSDSIVVAAVIVEPAEFAPVIEAAPAGLIVAVGGVAKFDVAARARPSPDYQWYKDGRPIQRATSEQLTINRVSEADSGSYAVVVWNAFGSDTSGTAYLQVTPAIPPIVTMQPADLVVAEGDTIRITMQASGDPEPLYMWQRNGDMIYGAVESTLIIPDARISDAGDYIAIALNLAGADTSETFTITVEETTVSVGDDLNGVPDVFALHGNYPNPFNPSTNIPFDLAAAGSVEITIYNVLGQRVEWIQKGLLVPGRYSERIDLSRLASGVYFYELRVKDGSIMLFRDVGNLVLMK